MKTHLINFLKVFGLALLGHLLGFWHFMMISSNGELTPYEALYGTLVITPLALPSIIMASALVSRFYPVYSIKNE